MDSWTLFRLYSCFCKQRKPLSAAFMPWQGFDIFHSFLCRKSYAALRELRLSIIPVKQHDKASRVRIFVTPLFVILCILFQLELEHLQFSFLSNYSLSLFASHNINYLYSLVKSIFQIIFRPQLQRRLRWKKGGAILAPPLSLVHYTELWTLSSQSPIA